MANTGLVYPDWLHNEVKQRQTDGNSQYIREAVIARMRDEDNGEWDAPNVSPESIPDPQAREEATADV